MEPFNSLFALVAAAGLLTGALISWLLQRPGALRTKVALATAESEAEKWRTRVEVLTSDVASAQAKAERVSQLEEEIKEQGKALLQAENQAAASAAELRTREQAHREQLAALTLVKEEIQKDLKGVTAEALKSNQDSFLQLANNLFSKHKAGVEEVAEVRQKAVNDLVTPIKDSLQKLEKQNDDMEKARLQAAGALTAELKAVAEAQFAVRAEASKLVNALRAAPKTRGRWGEHTLRNVIDLSGLSSYCDFTTEESFERDGALLRPDAIIRLPGNRSIVIDAKTSLTGYLDAIEAVDDAERERHLKSHANQIRTHMKSLSGKSYWDGLTSTPDFVVMFVPGDNFYAAAVEYDPHLFEDAAAMKVIIVTPATLIALAKAVAFGWRQEKIADNAKKIHELGRELYKRISTMTAHVSKTGSSLEKAVGNFNAFVGSFESSVLPQARRFNELEVEGTSAEIDALEAIDVTTRELRGAKDDTSADIDPGPPS